MILFNHCMKLRCLLASVFGYCAGGGEDIRTSFMDSQFLLDHL